MPHRPLKHPVRPLLNPVTPNRAAFYSMKNTNPILDILGCILFTALCVVAYVLI